jgi:hypothetical protein
MPSSCNKKVQNRDVILFWKKLGDVGWQSQWDAEFSKVIHKGASIAGHAASQPTWISWSLARGVVVPSMVVLRPDSRLPMEDHHAIGLVGLGVASGHLQRRDAF